MSEQQSRPVPERPPFLGPAAIGFAAAAVFIGGFALWAAVVPLASAALAPGIIVLNSDRKVVQHLEGGLVDEIFVKEGDIVKAGQPLLGLSSIQSRAALEVLNIRYRTTLAERARLIAERDGRDDIVFPAELSGSEPHARELRESQTVMFRARLLSVASQTDILNRRIAQLNEEISGLKKAAEAQHIQKRLIATEIRGVSELVDKGLEKLPRLLALQRAAADIDRQIALNRAGIARLEQRIGETLLQIDSLKITLLNEAAEKLREVEQVILDTRERLAASKDVMQRTMLRAPVDGQVMGLQVATVGGVVQPSQPLMSIVPTEEPLVIKARINPTDIDDVHAGLSAQVRLSAFDIRSTPLLEGVVETVSGDVHQDERTGENYYESRVRLSPKELGKIGDQKLLPGMPAEVMIQIAPRTPLTYFIEPLLHHVELSFLEK